MREATYEIRVRGRISRAALERLEGMEGGTSAVETVLHGPVRDQSELHGLLDRIKALGLELVEVRRLPFSPPDREPGGAPPAARGPSHSVP